jgi:hypothetical protein
MAVLSILKATTLGAFTHRRSKIKMKLKYIIVMEESYRAKYIKQQISTLDVNDILKIQIVDSEGNKTHWISIKPSELRDIEKVLTVKNGRWIK